MYTPSDVEVFVMTHKRPEFLKDTLDGYLSQTVTGFRLAVFSNGHSPQTKQLLQEYAPKGVEDFYVDEELPSEKNHTRALAASSRKILVVAHDDDFIHPQYIETVLALFNKYPQLAVVLSNSTEPSAIWDREPCRRAYHLKNPHEFAGYIYSGGGFMYSSACYKTEHVKRTDPHVGRPCGKVGDVPFMVTVCKGGEAAVTLFPFIKGRMHAEQDTFNYATGPTAEQWFNLALFYKKLLDRADFPRLQKLFLLQNYRHIRIGWKDWCKCEYSSMNFHQFCKQALACGALTKKNLWVGRILRGKFSRWLQRAICHFQQITY